MHFADDSARVLRYNRNMKNYWTQPSLSRDFALLSAAVFLVLFLVSMWVTFVTYTHHSERIARERISRYAAGSSKTDPYLIGFWSEVLKHVKTLTPGDLTAITNPWDLAALRSCVERMRAS